MRLPRGARAALLAAAALPFAASAASTAELDQVRARILKILPELKPEDIRPSSAPGLYEVQRGTAFGYVTADGRYLVRGDLIDLSTGEVLTETRRRVARVEAMKKLDAQAIAYSPPQDLVEHTVYVFVDVDCNYCRQLHHQVRDVNAQGIALKYVFYPRFGPQSDAFRSAQTVYCSKDPAQSLTQLFSGGSLKDPRSDCANPVAEQYAAAVSMGVKGTPMMVLPDGSTVYGFVSAKSLAELLNGGDPAPAAEAAPQ